MSRDDKTCLVITGHVSCSDLISMEIPPCGKHVAISRCGARITLGAWNGEARGRGGFLIAWQRYPESVYKLWTRQFNTVKVYTNFGTEKSTPCTCILFSELTIQHSNNTIFGTVKSTPWTCILFSELKAQRQGCSYYFRNALEVYTILVTERSMPWNYTLLSEVTTQRPGSVYYSRN